jgi:thioesterase domain-containing protein/acyl carrier protein
MEELKIPRMLPGHSFFNDLGGDSIMAVTVLERIRTELGINLSYFILFRYRTLEKLVEYIHRVENKVVSIEILREPKDNKSPVIIFVPPVKGGADTYRFALKSYPENFGLFELTYNLADDENKQFYTLDYLMELAAKAIEQLNIPEVSLYGYSMGGLLAYEIASRVELVKVKSVIILDIPPALKKKRNVLGVAYNDFRLFFKNIRKKDWKAVKMNLWHISICHYYLFTAGNTIKRFERKNNISMAEAAHLRFYRQFSHQPFKGDMLLIRSTDPHLKHYKYRWEKFVKGTITTEKIETTHYQMLNHANNDLLTQIVVHYFQEK